MAGMQPIRGRIETEHDEILRRNFSLLDDIDPSHIVSAMLEEHILEFDDHEEIEKGETMKKSRDILIRKLRYSGKQSFYKFLLILQTRGYKHIADKLHEQLSKQSKLQYIQYQQSKEHNQNIGQRSRSPERVPEVHNVQVQQENTSRTPDEHSEKDSDDQMDYEDIIDEVDSQTEYTQLVHVMDNKSSHSVPDKIYENDPDYQNLAKTSRKEQSFPKPCTIGSKIRYSNVVEAEVNTSSAEPVGKKGTVECENNMHVDDMNYSNSQNVADSAKSRASVTTRESRYDPQKYDCHPIAEIEPTEYANETVSKMILKEPASVSEKFSLPSSAVYTNGRLSYFNDQLREVPGWYPGINDQNYEEVQHQCQDKENGTYFFWYSEIKDTVIVTVILHEERDKRVNFKVKMKTRSSDLECFYYFHKEDRFHSLRELVQYTICNGIRLSTK